MDKADEYLRRATECVEMAKRAKTDHENKALLQIALAWHELAETGKLIPPLTGDDDDRHRRLVVHGSSGFQHDAGQRHHRDAAQGPHQQRDQRSSMRCRQAT